MNTTVKNVFFGVVLTSSGVLFGADVPRENPFERGQMLFRSSEVVLGNWALGGHSPVHRANQRVDVPEKQLRAGILYNMQRLLSGYAGVVGDLPVGDAGQRQILACSLDYNSGKLARLADKYEAGVAREERLHHPQTVARIQERAARLRADLEAAAVGFDIDEFVAEFAGLGIGGRDPMEIG